MFNKKLSDQFSKGLLDEVKKVMKKKEKESSEKEMKGPESSCEEYSPVKAVGDTRQVQARIHGAKTSGTLKNKPAARYKQDGTLYKEGVVPTNDMPTQKDRQTAGKVADLLAKEKKVKKVAEGSDLPWKEDPKNPTRPVGTRKDEHGNVVKNVAKHLAKKAMKANEEVEIDESVKSSNPTHGYHGAIEAKDDAERAKRFAAMHVYVKKVVTPKGHLQDAKKPNVMVKHFLDSAHGRHLANAANAENLSNKEITTRFAHFKKSYDPAMHEEVEHNNCGTPECCGQCNDVVEVAPPGAKYERMIKHIKKGYAKDGKLTDQEKSIAYATAWKAKNEEAELDEAIDTMSDARLKYHATNDFPHGRYTRKEIKAEHERRRKSVPNYHAVKPSLNEEAEQIDELSKDTLMSYMDKKKVPSGTVVANTNDKNSMRKYTNRVVGGVRAAKRLMAKEEAEQIDEGTFLTPNAHAELKSMPKDAVKRHHDVYMATAKNFKKNGSHALAAAAEGAAREIKKRYMSEDAEQIDELSDATLKSYSRKALDQSKTLTGDQKVKRQVGARNAIDRLGNNTLAKEEAEQIDELSKKALGNYAYRAASELGSRGITTGLKIAADEPTEKNFKKMGNRQKGIATAVKKLTKEEDEQFEQDALNLSAEEFEAKWLTPQVSEIDEAFEELVEGRPKVMIQHPWDKNRKLHPVKDKDLIAKLRAKGYTNLGDRPSSENPINQLRKASTSMTGGHHVTLHTGEKHHVTNAQAARILEKHAAMKTSKEKLDYQDKLRDKEFLQQEAGK